MGGLPCLSSSPYAFWDTVSCDWPALGNTRVNDIHWSVCQEGPAVVGGVPRVLLLSAYRLADLVVLRVNSAYENVKLSQNQKKVQFTHRLISAHLYLEIYLSPTAKISGL